MQRKPFVQPIVICNIKEEKKGYKFIGWSTQKDGNKVDYKYGDIYKVDKILDLYPVCKPDEYVLTYELELIGEKPIKQKTTHDVKANIISDTYEREGYIFGWGKTRYKTKPDYVPDEGFYPHESFSVYPIWERKKFTLTYDANGGENASNEQTIETDKMTHLSDVIPERKGYVFLGWSENKSPGSALFQPKGQFADRRDVTLYAMWEEESIIEIESSVEITPRTTDGFGGWYHPGTVNKGGVTSDFARFVQMAPGPCVAYSIMMGDYYLKYKTQQPNPSTFFTNKRSFYIDDNNHATGDCMALIAKMEFDKTELKAQLDLGKPVVISGKNNTWNHFAIIVAYKQNGIDDNDFIVIDPLNSVTFTTNYTYKDFRGNFKYNADNITGFTNPMFIFN